jgi:hypothetical protein
MERIEVVEDVEFIESDETLLGISYYKNIQ